VEQPLSRSVLEDTRACPNEDYDGRVIRGYLFNCLQPAEPILGTRGSSGATLNQKVGAGGKATHGGHGAALSQEAGAGAAGARGGPGAAPSRETGIGDTGTCGGPGAALSREAGTGASGHVGVPDPQGTNSGVGRRVEREY
jgi:hypothetical protein